MQAKHTATPWQGRQAERVTHHGAEPRHHRQAKTQTVLGALVQVDAVKLFKNHQADQLDRIFRSDKTYRNEREIIVFGEFLGENSFAGHHENEPHKIVVFDILVGHKNKYFVKPRQFLEFGSTVEIPKVVYEGNLNDEFITSVRRNDFSLKEGVICKGCTTNGAYRGKIWMCKIKTQAYLDKLKCKFGKDWEKYGE